MIDEPTKRELEELVSLTYLGTNANSRLDHTRDAFEIGFVSGVDADNDLQWILGDEVMCWPRAGKFGKHLRSQRPTFCVRPPDAGPDFAPGGELFFNMLPNCASAGLPETHREKAADPTRNKAADGISPVDEVPQG